MGRGDEDRGDEPSVPAAASTGAELGPGRCSSSWLVSGFDPTEPQEAGKASGSCACRKKGLEAEVVARLGPSAS